MDAHLDSQRPAADLLVGALSEELHPGDRLLLDDEAAAWWVAGGGVDLYLELLEEGKVVWREHLFGVDAGQAFFGLPPHEALRVVARSRGETLLQAVSLAELSDLGSLAAPAEVWLDRLADAVADHSQRIDFVEATLAPGGSLKLRRGQRGAGAQGVVWTLVEGGRLRFLGEEILEAQEKAWVLPLTPRLWIEAMDSLHLSALAHGAPLPVGSRRGWMNAFHGLAVRHMADSLIEKRQRERRRLRTRDRLERRSQRSVLERFSQVIDRRPEEQDPDESPLVAACRALGEALGVRVEPPPYDARPASSPLALIEDLSRRARLRLRRVVLREGWWRRETRPMLAFRRDDGEPLVLLPDTGGGALWAPGSDTADRHPVDAGVAAGIDPVAWSFYRTLPDRPLVFWDLLSFAALRSRRDLAKAALSGALVATMGMLVPVATGLLVDVAIPSHQVSHLLLGALGLALAACAAFCFQYAQDIAILRFQGKVSEALQPALLDRLLRLPNPFFRRYSAGDLAERMKTVDDIESRMAEGLFTTVLSGVMSILNFLLMAYLAPRTALVAALLLAVILVVFAFFARRQAGTWMGIHRLEGKLAGFVLQMILGMHRIRVGGAEDRVFARWGDIALRFRDLVTTCYTAEVRYNTLLEGYQIFCLAVVFGVLSTAQNLTTGAFLAFVVAFGTTLAGVASLTKTVLASIELVPMFRRLRPLLETVPENELDKTHPGELSGRIEVTELTFRYAGATRDALSEVSFELEPGENVALVGPSGCGKSTLFRLILGFEQPGAGSIYFDGKDLAGLDLREVRHQIGVVLQHDELMEGSLYENIRGDNEITVEEALRAARKSGLHRDIEAMPLGLHTVISATGSEFSGGQVQRLLLARALAANPRLLLLDEATSALDNRSQAVVMESLDRLRVTRLFIAHRLSTVRRADRILVMRAGRVVERGTFDELVAQDGFFAELVERQLR